MVVKPYQPIHFATATSAIPSESIISVSRKYFSHTSYIMPAGVSFQTMSYDYQFIGFFFRHRPVQIQKIAI